MGEEKSVVWLSDRLLLKVTVKAGEEPPAIGPSAPLERQPQEPVKS